MNDALEVPVNPLKDHVRGPVDAPVTLVEYADFQCPRCRNTHEILPGTGVTPSS